MNGPALMTTENRNGGRVITFSSGVFNPSNPKDPGNYTKIHGTFKDTMGIFDVFDNMFGTLFKFLALMLSGAFGFKDKEKEVNNKNASTSQAQAQSKAQEQKPTVDDNVNLMNVVSTKFHDRDMIKDGIKGSELLSVLEKTLDRMSTPVLSHYKEILKDNPDHQFRHSPIEFIDLLARTDNQKIPLEAMEKELDRTRESVVRDNLGSVKLRKNGGWAEIEKLLAQDDQIRLAFYSYFEKTPELKKYLDDLRKDSKVMFTAGYSLADLIKEAETVQSKLADDNDKNVSDARAEARVDHVIDDEKEKLRKEVKYGRTTFNTPLGRELSRENGNKQLEIMEKDFKNFLSGWNHRDSSYLKDNEKLGQLISILSYGRQRVESFGLNFAELQKAFNDEIDYRRLFADDRAINLGMGAEFLKNLTSEKEKFLNMKVVKSESTMVENTIENLYSKENSPEMSANMASFLIKSKMLNENNFSNGWLNFFENFDDMKKIQVKMRDGSYLSFLRYGEDLNKYSSSDAEYYSKISDTRRPSVFVSETKKNDEIGSVFEKPQHSNLQDSPIKTEVKGEVRGIDLEELAKAKSDSNVIKTAPSNNSFGMMND